MASDIKTSQLCCLICACIRHYFPRRQGNRSGPQLASLRHGRLTPARISPGCPPCLRLGLGRSIALTESLRNSLPQAVLWTDGPAWHLIWPSLIEGVPGSFAKLNEKCAGDFVCSLCRTSTGGLGASSSVACPSQGAPSGKYPDDWIFCFQRTREETPSLYYPLSEGAENQNFKFL